MPPRPVFRPLSHGVFSAEKRRLEAQLATLQQQLTNKEEMASKREAELMTKIEDLKRECDAKISKATARITHLEEENDAFKATIRQWEEQKQYERTQAAAAEAVATADWVEVSLAPATPAQRPSTPSFLPSSPTLTEIAKVALAQGLVSASNSFPGSPSSQPGAAGPR